jgi:hypothetical protein
MVDLLANGIGLRRRQPREPINAWYGGRRVTLPLDRLQALFGRAGQYPTHNEGADQFRFEVIEALTDEVFDPSFHNREDAREHFRHDRTVTEFLLRHWPPLTPEQALNDLFGSPALLRAAAGGTDLTTDELELLGRERAPFGEVDRVRWSNADIPLLDELLALVGISLGDRDDNRRIQERDEADEFELATAAEVAGVGADDEEEPDDLDEQLDRDLDEVASLDALLGTELEPDDPMFDTSVLDRRDDAQADGGRPRPRQRRRDDGVTPAAADDPDLERWWG